jgi:hypothetical protein
MTTSAASLELDNIAAAAQGAVCPGLIDLMEKLLTAGKQHLREGHHEEALSCTKQAHEILSLGWVARDRSTLQKIRGQIYLIQTAAYFEQAAVLPTEERADWEREGFISARNSISFLSPAHKENWDILAQLNFYEGQYHRRNDNPTLAQTSFNEARNLLLQYAPEDIQLGEIEKLLKVVS